MKNLNVKKMMNFKSFTLVAIVVLAVFTVSCNKENDPFIADEAMFTESAELKSARTPAKGTLSIAEVAISADFNELVNALIYVDEELSTGLVDLFLNGKDQYTVFAPTDEAFNALYTALSTTEDPVNEISDLPAELVLDVLLYHVVEGRRAANSVVPKVNSRTITTLLGKTFSVNNEGTISAIGNSATITGPNQPATNGIIHIIDTVLLPI